MSNDYVVQEYRELSDAERALLVAVISRRNDAEQYLQQLERVHVVAHCTCGCPTIDLALDQAAQRIVGPSKIMADVEAVSPEGVRVGTMVHLRRHPVTGEEQLSELELYPLPEVDTFGLPSPEMIDWSTELPDA